MASEAEEVPDTYEEYAKVPKTSAMSSTLKRLIRRFEQREDEGDAHFHDRQNQVIQQLTDQMKHARKHGRAHFHPQEGQRLFQYFHLANDAELETATNNLVLEFEKYHPTRAKDGKARPEAWARRPQAHATKKYLTVLRRLLNSESERIKSFSGVEVNDLNLNRAYQASPLYQSMQKAGTRKKKGPYEFAVSMSQYHKPGIDQDKFTKAYIQKAVTNAGLTADEMSRMLVETGRRRSKVPLTHTPFPKKLAELVKREKGWGEYVHGLQPSQFTSKFKQYQFVRQFRKHLRSNRPDHLSEVMKKIYLEGEGASKRPEVYSAPQPEEAEPVPRRRKRRRIPALDDDEDYEPPPSMMSAETVENENGGAADDNVILHPPRPKKRSRPMVEEGGAAEINPQRVAQELQEANTKLHALFKLPILGDLHKQHRESLDPEYDVDLEGYTDKQYQEAFAYCT